MVARFLICGCLRAINDRPYGKHPYDNQPNGVFFIFIILFRPSSTCRAYTWEDLLLLRYPQEIGIQEI